MKKIEIVLATNNAGKCEEINAMLHELPITLITQSSLGVEAIQETGLSFIENAILKARHAAKMTQLPAIADDSGLVVEALQGRPGIYSARFAGEHGNDQANNQKLLAELKAVEAEKRQAYFYCALIFLRHELDPAPVICTGKWDGLILDAPRGDNGHGYDPVFYAPEEKKSAAELELMVKNKISHRGKAFQSLFSQLHDQWILR